MDSLSPAILLSILRSLLRLVFTSDSFLVSRGVESGLVSAGPGSELVEFSAQRGCRPFPLLVFSSSYCA